MNYVDGIKVFSFLPKEHENVATTLESPFQNKQSKMTISNADINYEEFLKILGGCQDSIEEEPEETDLDDITKNLVFFMAGKCFNDYSSSMKSNERSEELSSYFVSFLIDNYEDVLNKISYDLSPSDSENVEIYIINTMQQIIRDMDSQMSEEKPCEWERLKELLRTTDKREDINFVISLLDNGCSEETFNVLKMVFPKLIEVYNTRRK